MKKYFILYILLVLAAAAKAQQKPLYSQYITNSYLLNPAVAGLEKDVAIKLGHRNQWVGFEGAPKTFYLSGHTALGKSDSDDPKAFHGVGSYLFNDQAGAISRTGMSLSYAYHIPVSRTIYASVGAFAGFEQFRMNADYIRLANNSNDQDPVTSQGSQQRIMPDLSLGAYLHSDKFFVGLSSMQLLGGKMFKYEAAEGEPANKLYRHLILSSGYFYELNKNVMLAPSALLKYVYGAPLQADINMRGIYRFNNQEESYYDDKVWAGLSYRTQDAIVVLVGGNFLKNFEINYSYDITTSSIRHHSAGSHEIVLGYRLKF